MFNRKRIRFDFWNFVTLFSLVFFGMFLVIPVGKMILYAFQGKGVEGFTLANFIKFFSRRYYVSALTNSIKVVLSATFLIVLFGVPLAYIGTYKIRWKRFIDVLILSDLIPFIGAILG